MSPSKPDDLLPLLTKAATQNQPLLSGMGQPGSLTNFGQGRILAWNPSTFENSVAFRGGVLTNLPVMSGPDALTYKPDDIVSIQSSSPNGGAATHWIAGRIIIPGPGKGEEAIAWMTSELGRRIAASVFASRIKFDIVPDIESGAPGASFGDLPTVGPTVSEVDITEAGVMIVFISANMQLPAAGFVGAYMSVEVDGPSPKIPYFDNSLALSTADAKGGGMAIRATSAFIYDNMDTGSYQVRAKYRGTNCTFGDREVFVISL
jgi:hypothetical protein